MRGFAGQMTTAMSGKRRRRTKSPVRALPLSGFCPRLTDANHSVTSPATFRYNCLAWAAGGAAKKWGDQAPYYWPKDVERGADIESLIRLFEWLGFERCADGEFEVGCEKVALYSFEGIWTHAARQKSDGVWTSKLGDFEDIDHTDPEDVAGGDYGEIAAFLKREKSRGIKSKRPR